MTKQKSALTRSPQSANSPPTQPTAVAQPGRSEHNRQLCQLAHKRLDTLIEEAEHGSLFGVVAIEASFEAGRLTTIRRRIDGTDK